MLIVTRTEVPKQEWLLLFVNEFPQIVHSPRRNSDASQTTFATQGNVLHPAISIYPKRTVNQQSPSIGCLIVSIHAFYSETILIDVSMLFSNKESA